MGTKILMLLEKCNSAKGRRQELRLNNPPPVLTKSDFVKRYKLGEFGNASPTWSSLEDLNNCLKPTLNIKGTFHIRNRVAGGPTFYGLDFWSLVHEWENLCCTGMDENSLYISEMAPHEEAGLIQGEIRLTENGVEFYYTSAALPMREAFKKWSGHTYKGLDALLWIRENMDPMSYEQLQYLMEAYPNHVIEFSTFGINWGTIPNRNTVFWEIRSDRAVGSNRSKFTEVY